MDNRKKTICTISIILLFLIFIISMNVGYIKLSPKDTLRTVFGGGTDEEKLILFNFRLPRIIISMLVGGGLALSGCIIQGLSRNPLADPGLLGINAGAGLMVILYVIFFGSQSFLSVFTLPFLAFLGASLAAILIYLLSYKRGSGLSPLNFILTGVAIQAGISALTTILVVKLDETQFNFVATWQAGSIWGSNWKFVLALVPWLLILTPYVIYKRKVLYLKPRRGNSKISRSISRKREKKPNYGISGFGSILCFYKWKYKFCRSVSTAFSKEISRTKA